MFEVKHVTDKGNWSSMINHLSCAFTPLRVDKSVGKKNKMKN